MLDCGSQQGMANAFVSAACGTSLRAARRRFRAESSPRRSGGRREMVMRERQRLSTNAPGEFYVDSSCIDCDTCRWMTPDVFDRKHSKSFVHSQPQSDDEWRRATQALLACPTGSIRTESRNNATKDVMNDFPKRISDKLEGVYHNGFHSQYSFGATSYLLVDEGQPGIMIDSPRFFEPLAKSIEKLVGEHGVEYMFLTHRDDVSDHAKWAERLGMKRIIHCTQVNRHQGTHKVEWILEGEGPWTLREGKEIIYVPGHTNGDIALLDRGRRLIFNGDTFGYSKSIDGISGFPFVNHYSWPVQVESIKQMTNMEVDWVLPGHGRRIYFEDNDKRQRMVKKFLEGQATKAAHEHGWDI